MATKKERPPRERLLEPKPDLPRPERAVAENAIDLVGDLSTRYEPGEAARFIRDLHNELVDTWNRLESHDEGIHEQRGRRRSSRGSLTGVVGEPLSRRERIAILERGLTRRFERRRRLRDESIGASRASELLGISRQTLYERQRAGRLFAVRIDHSLLFPIWQFDPDQPDGVLPHFPRVLDALHDLSPVAKYAWLTSPKPALQGEAPIDLLRKLEGDAVVRLARGAGVA